ncbi:MAG: hypothetical protein IOC54_17115 [Methylobacterium sp.]|nr:hypothetical protein [Methylobacterium sp.]
MPRPKWEIKRDISLLEGLRNEAYASRDRWYDDLKSAGENLTRYKELARQLKGPDQEKYEELKQLAQNRVDECWANIRILDDRIDSLGSDLAELDRELAEYGPGGGPGSGPPPAAAISELTLEKKKELEQNKTPKIGGSGLGDDFDDM